MLKSVSWSTYSVAGIDIAAVSPRRAAALLAARRVKEVHLCNTYTLSEVDRDPELRSALALADMIGLDVLLAVMEVLSRDVADPKYRPALLLKEMVAAGYLGRKTGRGFFKY